VGVAFFLNLVVAGGLSAAEQRWRTLSARLFCIGSLLAVCTFIEVEKASEVFGLGLAGVLEGELSASNHALHALSAALGWWLMRALHYRSR
jgi:hypothetical protein